MSVQGEKCELAFTGASGFVGRALHAHLSQCPRKFQIIERPALEGLLAGDTGLLPEKLPPVLIHLAGRAHVLAETATDPRTEYQRTNVTLTLALARAAAARGCRRFVFVSTIKVNGEATAPGQVFTESSAPAPQDDYAQSKYDAEQGLWALGEETGMEIVIVRPPLMYGPGVKGNLARLQRWLERGLPLPFGAINNRRSLLALENMVTLLVCCADHPDAAHQLFLASDNDDLSTPQLLRKMARATGRRARLVPVPGPVLRLMLTLLGRTGLAQRLLGSLQVDCRKARTRLGWAPLPTDQTFKEKSP
ncbi:NAD-dependent epimerase/dehydratase family protein [Marinimicrobium alkaliphilum]|uniref:NAD-dependent epimerase/dehydratase family protein n=1 Tax=Marinimicrobium alkaliphilum TaxID=2202654 RepID=UPI000DB9CE37|nr:NAD-dependent epimerase/dehydratase family protein [Marinimicrobium alkaliphilum]